MVEDGKLSYNAFASNAISGSGPIVIASEANGMKEEVAGRGRGYQGGRRKSGAPPGEGGPVQRWWGR